MKLRTWMPKDIGAGTRVLLRIDGNVSVVRGRAVDNGRLEASVPELRALIDRGARIIVATHLGSPGGKHVSALSTAPVARLFGALAMTRIAHNASAAPWKDVARMDRENGDVVMLENLRFDAREEKNSAAFARALANLADVYVDNAFGVMHRTHASVAAITRFLPSFAGELVVREVSELSRPRSSPFVLALGGAKLETKIPLLARLGAEADAILLGGSIALPFLVALGRSPTGEPGVKLSVPSNAFTKHDVAAARRILRRLGKKILLPDDLVVGDDEKIVDVGPETSRAYATAIGGASSLFWNGPFGIFERKNGGDATKHFARAISRNGALRTVIGGGDTARFLREEKCLPRKAFVSTGGGAMLAFVAGEKMPGLEPLVLQS